MVTLRWRALMPLQRSRVLSGLRRRLSLRAGTPGVVPGADLILANTYELPVATASELGGITVGDGLADQPVYRQVGRDPVNRARSTWVKLTSPMAGAEPNASPENGHIYTNTR